MKPNFTNKSTRLIILLGILFFTTSCGQSEQMIVKKNDLLEKDIILKPNIVKIIDSTFTFTDEAKKIESVQFFDLKNGILVSGERKYYVGDTLNQTTHYRFDANGNNIESNTLLHFKNSNQKFVQERDKNGSLTKLTTIEGDRTNVIFYQNSYRQNRLSEVSAVSEITGKVFDKTSYKYDATGNLLEEWSKNSHLDAKNIYQYNENNKVTLYKHIRNGSLDDSIVYFYHQGLLSKQEWYESLSTNPMVENYFYNKAKQLVMIRQGESLDKTEYKEYDEMNNWQRKEQYSYGKISRLTTRKFLVK